MQIADLLTPLVVDTDVTMEVSSFAAVALGLTFVGTCHAASVEAMLQARAQPLMMMILHLFQPHQADQMSDPDRILRMQALTNPNQVILPPLLSRPLMSMLHRAQEWRELSSITASPPAAGQASVSPTSEASAGKGHVCGVASRLVTICGK